jgi:RNA polymerase sigma-70 factor, ECF subfamily
MRQTSLTLDGGFIAEEHAVDAVSAEKRLRGLVEAHYDFVWRSLRRLGVRHADIDDAVQQVFLVASRKLASIRPESERSFLYQTGLRVAADSRRTRKRRREVTSDDAHELIDQAPGADDLVDLQRARSTLDRILDCMPLDLRAVFTLFELDQLTLTQIAALLELPRGTVASRLRRARVEFFDHAARLTPGGKSGDDP